MRTLLVIISDYYGRSESIVNMFMALATIFFLKNKIIIIPEEKLKEALQKLEKKKNDDLPPLTIQIGEIKRDNLTILRNQGIHDAIGNSCFENCIDFIASMHNYHENHKAQISNKLFRLMEQTAIKIENVIAVHHGNKSLSYLDELGRKLTEQ